MKKMNYLVLSILTYAVLLVTPIFELFGFEKFNEITLTMFALILIPLGYAIMFRKSIKKYEKYIIFLIIIVISIVIYMGILSPVNIISQKCEFTEGLDCDEVPEAYNDKIMFSLTNSLGYDITITDISSMGCTGSSYNPDVTYGESVMITLVGCDELEQGEMFSQNIVMLYEEPESTEVESLGYVSGKVGEKR